MKRRQFLKNTMLGAPLLLNGIGVSALAKPFFFGPKEEETDRVLVLIQLNGGNDGLNTLIPLDQYDKLYKARTNIIIPENKIIPFTNELGLHPSMEGIKTLYEEGKLGIYQNVGYPNQNRSHFRSMEIWSTASPSSGHEPTGWLGRYLDQEFPGYPDSYPNAGNPDPFGISMGSYVSETCQGAAANFSITLEDPFTLSPIPEEERDGQYGPFFKNEFDFIQSMISQTNSYGEKIKDAANRGRNLVQYPAERLAHQLKTVARLISGGLQSKIYVVSLGGFDTHANQVEEGDKTSGEHSDLLKTLSDAVKAFQDDLRQQQLEERVLGMTFSEFGRQIASNNSFGSDHGTAAPLLLFGSCVNTSIMGDNPDIPDELAPQEGVPMQYDFRDVYGSILMQWFHVPRESVMDILHQDFRLLPVVNNCNIITSSSSPLQEEQIAISNFPNPFRDWTTIQFTCKGEWVRLSVFDSLGREIRVLSNQRMTEGTHQIRFAAHGLPAGNYCYQIITGGQQKTGLMVKE